MMTATVSFQQMLAEQLKDPDFREDWERTAFARAVANQVIRYRIDHGLSQSALARRLGVSQAVVGRLELGEHEPRFSTLQKLSNILGLTFTITIQPASPGSPNHAQGFTANGAADQLGRHDDEATVEGEFCEVGSER